MFKVPFYQVTLRGIRDYYNSGGDRRQLAAARARAAALRPPPKRTSNERAIRAFEHSSQTSRDITPTTAGTLRAPLTRDIELRLRIDLEELEDDKPRRVLYNLRNVSLDADVAASTLHTAYLDNR